MSSLALRLWTAIVTLLVALGATPVSAQDWSALRKDPEVANYALTLDKVRTLVAVERALVAVAATDPQAMPAIDREFKAMRQGATPPTVKAAAAIIERHPSVRDALSKSGATPHEWLLTVSAVNNAALEMLTRKYKNGATASGGTAAQQANVALLENNQADWQKLEQEMRRLAEVSAPKAKE
jgi:hypothetical protein